MSDDTSQSNTSQSNSSPYRTQVLTTHAALEELRPEWQALFDRSETRNPFAAPTWMIAWAQEFIPPRCVRVLVIRDGDEVVGVAPFHIVRTDVMGVGLLPRLELFGSGRAVALTELPQVLTLPGLERQLLREVTQQLFVLPDHWHWAQLTLTPRQGWFEAQWLPDRPMRGESYVVHKGSRACVLLPVASSWEEQRKGFKRNLKESIRRGANRLSRDGLDWKISRVHAANDMPVAIRTLADLHGRRATLTNTVSHMNALDSSADRQGLSAAATAMTNADGACCYELRVNDEVVASLLTLRGGGCTYISFSGVDPNYWQYGAVTTLQAEAVKDAVDAGDTVVNLSTGPNVAKLRWSEQLETHQDFLVVGPGHRSAQAFTAFWQVSAAMKLRRERRYSA